MPKSKEVISSSGSDSDSGSEPKQKKKKVEAKPNTKASTSDSKVSKGASKKSSSKSDDGDETKFEIGKNRFATVCEFHGKKMVNIREFYQNDDGDMKPGRKGIALSIEQWNKLKDQIEDIDEALEAL